MARARNIKPGFFTNEELVELPFHTRLLFIGLWTLCDRAGRMEDRPKRIKMALFPADEIDVDQSLNELKESGFLVRYEHDGSQYIQVLAFDKHQNPHRDEKHSIIPAPCGHYASTVQCCLEHDANLADSLIPDSPIPDSLNPETGAVAQDAPLSLPAKRQKASKSSVTSSRPVDVSEVVWLSFVAVRNKKKAAITDLAILGIRREAVKAGITLEDALTICCEKGWAGFEAGWIDKDKPRQNGKPNANAALFASMTHLHQQPQRQPEENHGRTIDATPLLG